MKPTWKFKPLDKDDKLVDPIQHEFFTTESVGELPEALVREAIQNSLDAKLAGSETPVRVRIYLSEAAGAVHNHGVFFDGLQPHLEARGNGLDNSPDLNRALSFLVIEDFGTKGLLGSPEEHYVDEDARGEHNFFYFWRNIGRSEKSEKDRGRWGLGKTVFPASSRINSFFGLTIPESQPEGLLMGQSVLKTHKIGQELYRPYGDFGVFRNEIGAQYFARPARDEQLIKIFSEIFCLKRGGESGLSIVIPAPIEEIKLTGLISAVLRQYFYPVLSGDLVVELESTSFTIEINAESITSALAYCPELERGSWAKLFEFTKWALGRGVEDYIELSSSNSSAAPTWHSFLEQIDQASLQEVFDTNGRVAFKVQLRVQREKSREIDLSNFAVFLERDAELRKGQGTFIRQGITITGIPSQIEGSLRGLAVFTDRPLATLLGDAENPAHTEWQKNSPKFKGKYKHGPSTLNFVKVCLRELALFLTRPQGGIDKELMKDFFFLENRPDESVGPTVLRPDDDSEPEETPVPPMVPGGGGEPIRLTRLQGGVRVTIATEARISLPSAMTLEFAYGVRRGNPFKRYHQLDFDLGSEPIIVTPYHASIEGLTENRIELTALDEEFALTVTGFDPSRDLIVRAVHHND